jgi:hypothetical protein
VSVVNHDEFVLVGIVGWSCWLVLLVGLVGLVDWSCWLVLLVGWLVGWSCWLVLLVGWLVLLVLLVGWLVGLVGWLVGTFDPWSIRESQKFAMDIRSDVDQWRFEDLMHSHGTYSKQRHSNAVHCQLVPIVADTRCYDTC